MFKQKRKGWPLSGRALRMIKPSLISTEGLPEAAESDDVTELAASLSRNGLINPLIVRKSARGYQLIAGARRLRAARMCGMRRVPCRVVRADNELFWALRLSENIQRREPDFLETARCLEHLVRDLGVSIERAGELSGLGAGQVASRLHTLRLPGHMLMALRDSGLTQRHASALLRISSDPVREAALCEMAYLDMGPEAAEKYVSGLLATRSPEDFPGQRPLYIVKDVRMFLNSVTHGIDMMRGGGIEAECVREDCDNCIKLTIRIPDRTPLQERAG